MFASSRQESTDIDLYAFDSFILFFMILFLSANAHAKYKIN